MMQRFPFPDPLPASALPPSRVAGKKGVRHTPTMPDPRIGMRRPGPGSRSRPTGRHTRGLTLLELLTVLVLASLLGTLVVQGMGFFLGRYQTVDRVGREALLVALQRHWFVSTVEGMVPSLRDTRRFEGEATSFEGTTLRALAAQPGRPVKVRWSIDPQDGASSTVTYKEEHGVEWTVFTLPESTLSFEYADPTGRWHDRWPLDVRSRLGIPDMVRLVSDPGRVVLVARTDLFPEPVRNYEAPS